jgi:putative cell wall-binding protein
VFVVSKNYLIKIFQMKKVFSVVTAIAIAISIVPTSFAAARSNVIITTDGPAAGDVEIDAQDVELLSLHIDANVDVEFRNFPIKIRSTELAGSPAQGLLNGVESNYTDIKVVDANSGNVVFGPIDSSELKTVIGGANRITDRGGDQIGYFPFDDGFVVQSGKPADLIVTADVANNAELVGSTLNAYMQNNSQYPEIRKLSNNALATLNPRAVIAGKDMKIVGRQEDFNHPIITLAADTPSGFRAPSFAETILKFNVTAPEEAIQVEKVVVKPNQQFI